MNHVMSHVTCRMSHVTSHVSCDTQKSQSACTLQYGDPIGYSVALLIVAPNTIAQVNCVPVKGMAVAALARGLMAMAMTMTL